MIYVNLACMVSMVAFWAFSKNYDKRRLRHLYHPKGFYKLCFPAAALLYKKIFYKRVQNTGRVLKKLYPTCNVVHMQEEKYLKNISLSFIVFISIHCLCICIRAMEIYSSPIINDYYVRRNPYGSGGKDIVLDAFVNETKEQVGVSIGERRYTADEMVEIKKQCEIYIRQNIISENQDTAHILFDLNFMNQVPEYCIDIQWKSDNYTVIGMNGKIKNDELTDPVEVTLTAVCSYFEMVWEYSFTVTVLPPEKNINEEKERLDEVILQQEELTNTNEFMELPESVNGERIIWKDGSGTKAWIVLLLGGILIISIFVRERENMAKSEKKRLEQLSMDYPVFVHKFVLLLGAGLTAKAAWQRIVSDYQKAFSSGEKMKYVYEEMIVAVNEMGQGITEVAAYEAFGRRCGLNQYLKFSSILIQCVRTGAKGLGRMLNDAADEAALLRRESAKRLGEEAGTKMLFPMIILLALIMIILIIPAFMSMNF